MPRRFACLILLSCLCQLAAAGEHLAELKAGDTVYTDVTVMDISATDILFKHSTGLSSLKLRYLAPELQQKFNFDPDRSRAAERRADAATAEYGRSLSQRIWDAFFSARTAAAEKAEAETPAGFKLAEPLNDTSPLNKPAPPLAPTQWYSAKPSAPTNRFVLSFFWKSTSEPCRRFIPALNDWQAKFPDDLTIIGITPDSASEVEAAALPAMKFSYGGANKTNLVQTAGITSVPAVVLVDPKGKVRYHGHPGALNDAVLAAFIGHPPASTAAPAGTAPTGLKPFAVRRLEWQTNLVNP